MVLNRNCRTVKCAVSPKDMNTQPKKKCFSLTDNHIPESWVKSGVREKILLKIELEPFNDMYINIHLSWMNLPGGSVEILTVPGLQLAWSLWERGQGGSFSFLFASFVCSWAGQEGFEGKGDLAAPQRSGEQRQLKLSSFYIVICFINAHNLE